MGVHWAQIVPFVNWRRLEALWPIATRTARPAGTRPLDQRGGRFRRKAILTSWAMLPTPTCSITAAR